MFVVVYVSCIGCERELHLTERQAEEMSGRLCRCCEAQARRASS